MRAGAETRVARPAMCFGCKNAGRDSRLCRNVVGHRKEPEHRGGRNWVDCLFRPAVRALLLCQPKTFALRGAPKSSTDHFADQSNNQERQ
jgi:hypothetical protein